MIILLFKTCSWLLISPAFATYPRWGNVYTRRRNRFLEMCLKISIVCSQVRHSSQNEKLLTTGFPVSGKEVNTYNCVLLYTPCRHSTECTLVILLHIVLIHPGWVKSSWEEGFCCIKEGGDKLGLLAQSYQSVCPGLTSGNLHHCLEPMAGPMTGGCMWMTVACWTISIPCYHW